MSIDMDLVKGAAKQLVTAPNASDLFKILDSAVRRGVGLPIRLTREFAAMNPLLALSQENHELYETIIQWVFDKRDAMGLDPLRDVTVYNKNSYMREFMANKRERERRAVDIENMLRSDKDRLKGKSRIEFVQRQSAYWKHHRDKLVEAERKALGAKHLPQDVYSKVLKNFWADVDRQLDEMEMMTIEELRKPVLQRQALSPQMQALKNALESDPNA